MTSRIDPIFVILIGLLLSFTSCVKDSEVSSSQSRLASPMLESDLIISTLDASNFIIEEQRSEVMMLTDTMNLERMEPDFMAGQLIKAQLNFKFINSLDRTFKVDFEFLDDLNVLKHSFQIPVSSGSLETPTAVEANVIIKEPELMTFKEATKLVYKITLPSSKTSLTTDTQGKISLLSKATHFFEM